MYTNFLAFSILLRYPTLSIRSRSVHVQSNSKQTTVTEPKNRKPKKKTAILNGLDWFAVPLE